MGKKTDEERSHRREIPRRDLTGNGTDEERSHVREVSVGVD